jgi:tetratricopeptide (TPR) repeat protein
MNVVMDQPNVEEPIMKADVLGMALMDGPDNDNHNNDWKNNNSHDPFPFLYSGRQELQDENYDAAAKDLSRSTQLDGKNPEAWTLLALAKNGLGDKPGAAEAAKKALELDPNNKEARTISAFTEGRLGLDPSSRVDTGLSQGAAVFAGEGASGLSATGRQGAAAGAGSSTLLSQARGKLEVGDADGALALANRAVASNPSPDSYFIRAMAYAGNGDYASALSDALSGLAKDPKNAALMSVKAQALSRLKRYNEALAAAMQALEKNPSDAHASYALAHARAGMGDRAGMIAALRAAAASDPRYQAALDQALSLPENADLLFLFAGGPARGSGTGAALPSFTFFSKRFGLKSGVGAIGLGLLGLGLVLFVAGKRASAGPSPETEKAAPLLSGRFEILGPIGSGGMGVVYEGLDTSLGRKVALKRMRSELKIDARERRRFLDEARLSASLHHPNIVDIYTIIEQGDEVYLVFEFVAGRTLSDLIGEKGKLDLETALSVVSGIALALDYANGRGIVHRDLKPSNVMIDHGGTVKVMDFGIARVAKDALTRQTMTQTSTMAGTPPYMAPEAEQGLVRRESDIYSLGICLYEMLTGRLPFTGTGAGMLMGKIEKLYAPAGALSPELPSGIDEVLARALEPDPSRRIGSARELVGLLEALTLKGRG